MEPTSEQQAIIDAFLAGKHLVVQAGAGSGKTTTLRMLADADPSRRGLYVAFNKAIADEAGRKMPRTVIAKTAHALAFAAVGKQFSERLRTKGSWGATMQVLEPRGLMFKTDTGSRSLTPYLVTQIAYDTVRAYCQSAATQMSPRFVPTVPGLDSPLPGADRDNHERLVDFVYPLAEQIWEDWQDTEGVLRYDHAAYLKLWALSRPQLPGHYLLFDEAQDASPVLADVMNQQTHLQRVFVGDDSQSIMGFTGAINAMRAFSQEPDVEVLTLTRSFRFGAAIAEVANQVLADVSAPLRLTGNPDIASALTPLDRSRGGLASDAVLCRTNTGALDEVIQAQESGSKVALVGDQTDLRTFVQAAITLQSGERTNHYILMAFESWADVVAYAADGADQELGRFVDLVEEYGADKLLRCLDACVAEPSADVVVSTAHKAKGREWNKVRISPDFAIDDEQDADSLKAELMLAYVALTRAVYYLDPGLLGEWLGLTDITAVSPQDAVQNIANKVSPQSPTGVDDSAAGWVQVSIPADIRDRIRVVAERLNQPPAYVASRVLAMWLETVNG